MNESQLGKSGRHGGRGTPNAGIRDMAMDGVAAYSGLYSEDATPEQIAKVRALWERPGTEGERQAAAAALRRYGVDPESFSPKPTPKPQTPKYEQPKPKPTGPKRFRVTLKYEYNGKTMNFGPETVEAGDELEAESAVRKMAQEHWGATVGGRAPEFRASNTQRV